VGLKDGDNYSKSLEVFLSDKKCRCSDGQVSYRVEISNFVCTKKMLAKKDSDDFLKSMKEAQDFKEIIFCRDYPIRCNGCFLPLINITDSFTKCGKCGGICGDKTIINIELKKKKVRY
jgi:hypothetical protein